jgi:cytochrome c biogenesis protein CcdA
VTGAPRPNPEETAWSAEGNSYPLSLILKEYTMLVPLIMAIWFGVTAHKAGRKWYLWAPGGAVLAFVVVTVVTNLGAVMFGPFSIDVYVWFRIIAMVISIAITIWLGHLIMRNLRQKTATEKKDAPEPSVKDK